MSVEESPGFSRGGGFKMFGTLSLYRATKAR